MTSQREPRHARRRQQRERSSPARDRCAQAHAPRALAGAMLACLLGCAGSAPRARQAHWRAEVGSALPASERLPIDRIFADPPLAGRSPQGLQLSPDGLRMTYLQPSEADSEVLDLWALDLPDGEPRPLVRTSDLVAVDAIRLSEEERMALERRRIGQRGITSYGFCGREGRALLFPLSGDLYHVSLTTQSLEAGATTARPLVRRMTHDGKAKLNPTCSPDGTRISFTRERDLYVIDVESVLETRLTQSSASTQAFGVAEFIAQEEMGRFEGAYWSPEGRYLAYTEIDEAPVAVKMRPYIFADRTELFSQRYPAAGESNARVALHVYDFVRKVHVPVPLPEHDGYLARVSFVGREQLAVQWQRRDQKILTLLMGDAPAFRLIPVLDEADDAWVELHDDLRFFEDGERFLWSSERDGRRRIYQGRRGSLELLPVTPEGDPVLSLVGFDEPLGRVYYIRALERGLQHALFSVALDGSDERRLTPEDGEHVVTFGKAGLFLDRWSTLDTPPQVRLIDNEGNLVRMIDDNPARELRGLAQPEATFLRVSAADATPLNALLFSPISRPFGARVPLIVYVYGGPTAQLVQNSYARRYPFFVHLAQRGYAVLVVDNRGTAHRERAFTRAFLEGFGQVEIADQKHALREVLEAHPWIDRDRVGIFGWSYGGYVSALSVIEPDSPFRAAVSVAPVTDWALYDTHYTERYLGTPQQNPQGYARASLLERVRQSSGLAEGARTLFLVHGMADDNVLFSHSLKLMEALQEEGIPFDFMAYPGRAHGLAGRNTQRHLYRSVVDFFDRELAPQR